MSNVLVLDACALIAYFNNFNVSVADSVALGLAKLKGASLVTTDHHEFDPIEEAGEMRFHWLR